MPSIVLPEPRDVSIAPDDKDILRKRKCTVTEQTKKDPPPKNQWEMTGGARSKEISRTYPRRGHWETLYCTLITIQIMKN
jgi:hypothetical protein